MTWRTAAVLLLAPTTIGCSSATDLDGYQPRGTKLSSEVFSAWSIRSGSEPAPPLEVVGDQGAIAARGTIGTGNPCYSIVAFAQIHAREVRLDVVSTRAKNVICITVPGLFGYEAVIRDLSPGNYTVRVAHVANGRAETVLTSSVVVD